MHLYVMYISRSCEMQLSGNSPNKGVAINGIAIAISNIAYSEGREQLINNLIGGFLSPGQGGLKVFQWQKDILEILFLLDFAFLYFLGCFRD